MSFIYAANHHNGHKISINSYGKWEKFIHKKFKSLIGIFLNFSIKLQAANDMYVCWNITLN